MQMFIFQSGKDPEAFGFSNEPTGIALPQALAPWLLRGKREDFPDGTLTGIRSVSDALRALELCRQAHRARRRATEGGPIAVKRH